MLSDAVSQSSPTVRKRVSSRTLSLRVCLPGEWRYRTDQTSGPSDMKIASEECIAPLLSLSRGIVGIDCCSSGRSHPASLRCRRSKSSDRIGRLYGCSRLPGLLSSCSSNRSGSPSQAVNFPIRLPDLSPQSLNLPSMRRAVLWIGASPRRSKSCCSRIIKAARHLSMTPKGIGAFSVSASASPC